MAFGPKFTYEQIHKYIFNSNTSQNIQDKRKSAFSIYKHKIQN